MYEQVPNLLMCPNSFTHHFCVHVTVLPGYRKVPLDLPFIIQLGPHCFFVLKQVRRSRFSARLALNNLTDTVIGLSVYRLSTDYRPNGIRHLS